MQVDAKAAFGSAYDSAVTGAENASFATNRTLGEAKVSGTWGWNEWQASQSGGVTYIDETGTRMAGQTGASIDVTRLSIGPELRRHIDVGNDNSVEPFAFFKSSLDLADTGFEQSAAKVQNTIGGGVTVAKPDKYTVQATADYTQSSDSAADSATGKVSVSVPSSVLGF
jgi:hypothetical protein